MVVRFYQGRETFLYSKSIQTSSGTHLATYAMGNGGEEAFLMHKVGEV
jgi:hypothetical protein